MKSQPSWMVMVDKQHFGLTDEQYQLLKGASLAGKTMVWFDTFVISIPHISYMEKIRNTKLPGIPVLPEADVKDMSQKIKDAKKRILGI